MATGYKGIINKDILTKKCYSMYCEYCDIEFMIKVKSPPTRKKHTCGKWATQRCSGYSWVQKSDDQKRRRVSKFNQFGYNKDQARQFYDGSIEHTKKRIEGVGAASHYTPMHPDMDYMVNNGLATRDTDEVTRVKKKVSKENTLAATNEGKKINTKRSNNSQTILIK